MPGLGSLYRTWVTGDQLTAFDLTSSFQRVGIDNMVPLLIDDYSLDTGQMRTSTDPFTGGTEQAATTLAGELERLRFVIEMLTGWPHWYSHIGVPLTLQGSALSQAMAWNNGGVTFQGAWRLNVTDTASAVGSLLLDLLVGGTSKFKVDKSGNVTAAGNISAGGLTGFIVDPGHGGTGLDTSGVTDGQLLIGKDSINGFVLAALASADGSVTITLGAGTIDLSAKTTRGLYALRGLTGINNAGTPATKYDFAIDAVQVFNPSTFATTQLLSTGTLTCDLSVAGPASGGRDTVGALSNGWVYFYLIYNPTTTAKGVTASNTAWPTGPALPAGFTQWAPLHAVFITAGVLASTSVEDGWGSYQAHALALSGGASTTQATISLASLIPPFCAEIDLTSTGSFLGNTVTLRYITGVDYRVITHPTFQSGTQTYQDFTRMPVRGQQIFYLVSGVSTTIELLRYRIPNGGS